MCGTSIQPNPANMCVNCIRTQVDITEGIPKQLTMTFCKACGRYLQPPKYWVACELESRELLSLCLKRVRGLNKVKLVDAGFVWTEPHSRRIKVKLTVQKEVFASTILQQVFVIEYVVHTQQCDDCHQVLANIGWTALVQIRQKVDHKRTMFWLEQMIIKYRAHEKTLNIKEVPNGLDFYFGNRSHAAKLESFLSQITPTKVSSSKKLISQDEQNSTYNYKYTTLVELAKPCKDDLLWLSKKTAAAHGNISQLVLCLKVSNIIYLLDPFTLQIADMYSLAYWKSPPDVIGTRTQLTEYTVFDVEPLGPIHHKFALADIHLMRSADVGVNDDMVVVRSHLGNLLQPGDLALGYELKNANINAQNLQGFNQAQLPDIILVKKHYPASAKRARNRRWKLKHLLKETEMVGMKKSRADAQEAQQAQELEAFMQDLEEDPEMRANINLYRDPQARAARMSVQTDTDMEDLPTVGLEELLEDMHVDEPIVPGGAGVYDDDDDDVQGAVMGGGMGGVDAGAAPMPPPSIVAAGVTTMPVAQDNLDSAMDTD
eukprot:TRINITY_DN3994_c0_g1_i2.p1 TRINITY_DN3994_c0_g1~~TRINITY_DN3994_c0_g1_i2.p1  ORF type:complete len:544 (-),score=140.87 TRINITY_DN3994_c0_g1_i2:242-1873(-)